MNALAFATAAILLSAGVAHAEEPVGAPSALDMPHSVTLWYFPRDLDRYDGAATLVSQIRWAATIACGADNPGGDAERQARFDACVEASMGEAVAEVDAPLVTALYWAMNGRRVLSSD